MAIQYFTTKAQADAVPGGEVSWSLSKTNTPWMVATGSDITSITIDTDKEAVKAYAKLVALKSMTPTQVSTWVDANVTNLSQAQDAIKTLAIGMGYLIRLLY